MSTATDSPQPSPVLLDTDVFSKVFVVAQRDADGHRWTAALAGRTITISVQTAVELRAWPLLNSWGEKRRIQLENQINSIGTVQVTEDVQARFVELTVWAKLNGHGIHHKVHTADRWVAATALAHDLDLAAADGIYDNIVGLRRLTDIP